MKQRHAILFDQPIRRNSGGPSGYLWHLQQGLSKVSSDSYPVEIVFIGGASGEDSSSIPERPTLYRRARNVAERLPFAREFLNSFGPSSEARHLRAIINTPASAHRLDTAVEEVLARDASIVGLHCHSTIDVVRAHNSLMGIGRRSSVTLFLTSHCPELPSNENVYSMRNTHGVFGFMAEPARKRLLEIDEAAFDLCDVVASPCLESLESYHAESRNISRILETKRQLFVPTGIVDPGVKRILFSSASPLRLCYIGRHNSIKGYDVLANAVPAILDDIDATMTVVGSPGPVAAPSHPRWFEAGWVPTPLEIAASSDLFILANRQTYFDLVALEVMATGVAILATATGGNKHLARTSPGVILCKPDAASMSDSIRKCAAWGPQRMAGLGLENRIAYEAYYTAERFAEAYAAAITKELGKSAPRRWP